MTTLVTLAGVKTIVAELKTAIPGLTTADKIPGPGITVPGKLDLSDDIIIDGPLPSDPSDKSGKSERSDKLAVRAQNC